MRDTLVVVEPSRQRVVVDQGRPAPGTPSASPSPGIIGAELEAPRHGLSSEGKGKQRFREESRVLCEQKKSARGQEH